MIFLLSVIVLEYKSIKWRDGLILGVIMVCNGKTDTAQPLHLSGLRSDLLCLVCVCVGVGAALGLSDPCMFASRLYSQVLVKLLCNVTPSGTAYSFSLFPFDY